METDLNTRMTRTFQSDESATQILTVNAHRKDFKYFIIDILVLIYGIMAPIPMWVIYM